MYDKWFNYINEIKTIQKIREKHEYKLSKNQLKITNIILLKLKQYFENEEIFLVWYTYCLIFFNILDLNTEKIDKKIKDKVLLLKKSFEHEQKWEYKEFLETLFVMDNDLLLLKMRIKATIITSWNYFLNFFPNQKNHYKSIWYFIPFLTMKWLDSLSFFQDLYFEKFFSEQYKKTKKFYLKKLKQLEFPWEHLNKIVNDLSNIMFKNNILWITKIRRKSYFSIYNKLKRKKNEDMFDILWIKIIFKNMSVLNKVVKHFEKHFIYIQKKDYFKNPKDNWYKSIHYKFMTMYQNQEIWIELQIKTLAIEKTLKFSSIISHYTYTVNEKKWDSIFKEVHEWYKILEDYKKKNS